MVSVSRPTVSTKKPGPNPLPSVISLSPQKVPRHVNRTLALDVSHHARYRQFRRHIDQHVHVIRHDMPFFYPTFFMLRQSVKHLSQMFPYYSIQLPFPVLRNKYYVIFALPFCMTKTSVVFHGSFGFVALVGSQTHRTGRLLYKSNFRSLPGIAGGSPIDL